MRTTPVNTPFSHLHMDKSGYAGFRATLAYLFRQIIRVILRGLVRVVAQLVIDIIVTIYQPGEFNRTAIGTSAQRECR